MNHSIQKIGSLVKTVREEHQLSLEELAEKAYVPVKILADLENSIIGISTCQLGRIANVFNIDIYALWHGTISHNSETENKSFSEQKLHTDLAALLKAALSDSALLKGREKEFDQFVGDTVENFQSFLDWL